MQNRTDRQIALLLFAGIFGLYVRTAAPGLLFGDAGEFQVAAWTLGLAHPTGYPFYLILGYLWQHLLALFGVTPAYALNLLSALFGGLTIALLYLTLVDWLRAPAGVRRVTALVGALMLAVNPTFWSQSLIAEVYTLHAFLLLVILNLAYRLLLLTDKQQGAATKLAFTLALVTGLAFTHHAMTVMILPSVIFALWRARTSWGQGGANWVLLPLLFLMPLLLYIYVPLRSGPSASPWYHQALGEGTLTLYQNSWQSFLAFISGQSISVGFRDINDAVAQLSQAWLLWRLHLLIPGLVLMVAGLYVLLQARNWQVLALTVPLFLLQQIFNLFYNIGDILVYYIPLYIVGAIWLAYAVDTIGGGMAEWENTITEQERIADEKDRAEPARDWRDKQRKKENRPPALAVSFVVVLTVFWLPFQLGRQYFSQLDQSSATGARAMWESIVAAAPPAAILISNDRNEMVPLFYYQHVEGQLRDVTGLFSLMAPDGRFADIGATIQTALVAADDRPIYLIKEMPGLAVRFGMEPTTPPLVAVYEQEISAPAMQLDLPYGPLTLLGYHWEITDGERTIALQWQVDAPINRAYTTSVQLFDTGGEKVAQSDAVAGGNYYPTSLWKVGDVLVERHQLSLDDDRTPTTLFVTMYDGTTMTNLAAPLEIALDEGK